MFVNVFDISVRLIVPDDVCLHSCHLLSGILLSLDLQVKSAVGLCGADDLIHSGIFLPSRQGISRLPVRLALADGRVDALPNLGALPGVGKCGCRVLKVLLGIMPADELD